MDWQYINTQSRALRNKNIFHWGAMNKVPIGFYLFIIMEVFIFHLPLLYTDVQESSQRLSTRNHKGEYNRIFMKVPLSTMKCDVKNQFHYSLTSSFRKLLNKINIHRLLIQWVINVRHNK